MPDFAPTRPCRAAGATLALGGCLLLQGCFFGSSKKPPKVFVPPPVYAKDPPPAAPKDLPPPPADGTSVEPDVAPVVAVTPNIPPPPKPPPAKPVAPPKSPPTVVEVPPTPPPAAPKPATVFSAAERQSMNQEIDGLLERVRGVLARTEGKNLSAGLLALANQARANMLNAEQTRVQDLVTAVSLAKRAESFAMALAPRLP